MIRVDMSVWVDHLRNGNSRLGQLLESGRVLTHLFVIGELALGNLRDRSGVLSHLSHLVRASVATEEEVLYLIEQHGLSGAGIGYVDAHLLAATRLTQGGQIWTFDRRLRSAAGRLDVSYGAH